MTNLSKRKLQVKVPLGAVTILLMVSLHALSQVHYSVNPDYLRHVTEKNKLLYPVTAAYPDTSIIDFSNFLPRNFLGNYGYASPEYLFHFGSDKLGFRLYPLPYNETKYQDGDIKYYQTVGPYADVSGVVGSKELQLFRLLFTGTYSKGFNIALKLDRFTGAGFYPRQRAYDNNFYLSSNYTGVKKRAGFFFYLLNNSNKHQENGGIRDRTLNDSTIFLIKEIMPVRITAANRDNRQLTAMINPWVRLNRKDSSGKHEHLISLSSGFSSNLFRYTDQNMPRDTFYQKVYLDTTLTTDSTNVKQLVNDLSYIYKKGNDRSFKLGYRNELNQVWQYSDSLFINQMIYGDFVLRRNYPGDSLRVARSFENRISAEYAAAGPNASDFKIGESFMYSIFKKMRVNLVLNVMAEKRHPDYIYNRWVSNHFLWLNNGFEPTSQVQVRAGIHKARHAGLFVFYQNHSRYLYFNKEALPEQFNGTITNAGVELFYSHVLLKHLGVSLNYIFQTTSEPSLVRIPSNVTTAKVFYNGELFKKVLLLQIGMQVQVYDAFYPYDYMPATQAFFLQDKFGTERYPYLDAYLHARVRPVIVFVKVSNLLYGFAGSNYALAPGYYQRDRAFSLGLRWMFFD